MKYTEPIEKENRISSKSMKERLKSWMLLLELKPQPILRPIMIVSEMKIVQLQSFVPSQNTLMRVKVAALSYKNDWLVSRRLAMFQAPLLPRFGHL